MTLTILEAIEDPELFGSFLGDSHASWRPWFAALRFLYGLPTTKEERKLIRQCTGRKKVKNLPGFSTALILTGRRSGKSRVAALIGAYEAALAGHQKKLSKGELGMVAIVAPTKAQARIVKSYLRAIFDTPVLGAEVARETPTGFELRDGTLIEIQAGDWRSIRGYTLLAVVTDETAFMGLEEANKIRSDTELMRAVKPALATVSGKLIAISTPYAKKGWTYRTWKRNFKNEKAKVLVWNCPSRTMNSTLPQSVVDEALAEDRASARSEYLGEFRDDVGEWLPRKVIEELVARGRTALPPLARRPYSAFCDLSGGRSDDAALAIAHKEGRKVVLDLARRWKPPFDPYVVINHMTQILHEYGLSRVVGDNYGAEFVAGAFKSLGITYTKCDRPKSALYLELLPKMTSREVELLDDEVLVEQLAGLERRVRSGGKDIVDHGHGSHDDLANVVAGVCVVAATARTVVGGLGCMFSTKPETPELARRRMLEEMIKRDQATGVIGRWDSAVFRT